MLGCGVGEDSIEHYAMCRICRFVASRWLALDFRFQLPLHHWVLAAPACVEVDALPHWWSRVALLMYAVMKVTNAVRAGRPLTELDGLRALRHGLLEAVRGCPRAARLLDARPL